MKTAEEEYVAEGPGIDQPLAMLRGTTSYYEADGLGSITSLTDNSAAVASSYTYASFGKQIASSGTTVNPFRYTGREFDAESGLNYHRARYYDQPDGRFVSEDPIRFKGGVNWFAYVSNDPVGSRDPFGLLRDCDQEHIDCFRKCWAACPPWPIDRGKAGHYRYCSAKCLAQYMKCEAENAAEKVKNYCSQNPGTWCSNWRYSRRNNRAAGIGAGCGASSLRIDFEDSR